MCLLFIGERGRYLASHAQVNKLWRLYVDDTIASNIGQCIVKMPTQGQLLWCWVYLENSTFYKRDKYVLSSSSLSYGVCLYVDDTILCDILGNAHIQDFDIRRDAVSESNRMTMFSLVRTVTKISFG